MRKTIALFVILPLSAAAQKHVHPAVQIAPTTQLPITRVALYKNGVGFFEHAGRVLGDQSVTIDFTSAQLNDVLQSLTAIDLNGGRISGAGYNSTTPLEQQLKSLPLALSDDPSDVDFYNAIRGARVQVTGPGGSIAGRLLSIDLRPEVAKASADSGDKNDRRFLTVVADSGAVKTLEITSVTTVTLLDGALRTDITRYLELLASNRSQGLRHLTLLDRGTGSRDLRVSYISEVPVWKSTYRILFTDGSAASTATLQGWSVVDNTTGSDWLNVHLDLIAGAPQSFIQPLSTPYYTRRPEIPLPAEAQLAPQTHDSGDVQMMKEDGAPPPVAGSASQTVEVTAGVVSQQELATLPVNGRVDGKAKMRGRGLGTGSGAGYGGTVGGPMALLAPAAPPIDYAEAAQASITPQTTSAAFDDYFKYSITDPITIRKNESALVPILQTSLPIERVTLWSPAQSTALRALWLTNSSGLTLDRGSFSIVESGNFGGEGLLDPIHPGERRLLSYAADQAVRVTTSNASSTRKVQRVTISKGVLTETASDVADYTYDIRNAAPEPRTVIVEDPVRPGYTLDAAPKPDETTTSVNRFRVVAAPGQTAHLHLVSRHTDLEYIRLVDRTEDQLVFLLRNAHVSPAAMALLQPVFDAHHQVVVLDAQINAAQTEISTIAGDQNRVRENLKALRGTAEEKALTARYTGELNAQEDRLAALNSQIAQLRTERATAEADFQNRLAAISFDETL